MSEVKKYIMPEHRAWLRENVENLERMFDGDHPWSGPVLALLDRIDELEEGLRKIVDGRQPGGPFFSADEEIPAIERFARTLLGDEEDDA